MALDGIDVPDSVKVVFPNGGAPAGIRRQTKRTPMAPSGP